GHSGHDRCRSRRQGATGGFRSQPLLGQGGRGRGLGQALRSQADRGRARGREGVMTAPVTRRSAFSTIAAVTVAAALPAAALAVVNPDAELISLGRRFDGLVVKWAELFALPSTDIDDEASQAAIDRLVDEMRPIEHRIIALRATTLDGLRVKVRVVK